MRSIGADRSGLVEPEDATSVNNPVAASARCASSGVHGSQASRVGHLGTLAETAPTGRMGGPVDSDLG